MLKNNIIKSKLSQVTIFIILAIIIVAVVILFVLFSGKIATSNIPKDLEPVYSYYLSCIDYEAKNGALLLGESGGHIKETEFSPGSEYMPFSSHLGFLGNAVPYWFYISGNGLTVEKIPSIGNMQLELNDYIKEGMKYCDFSSFEEKGFVVSLSEPAVTSTINDNSIVSNVKQDISIKFGKEAWTGKSHSVETKTNLGRFYSLAKKIYNDNKQKMFLENYGVDILRLYAPVDGSEITCGTKIWPLSDVRENLTQALEANIPAIKIKGDYYRLKTKENKYFVRDIGEQTDYNVNFMFSRNFPMKIEVWPSENEILKAEPIGLQEGLGMLGFCYVPYHFVYDFSYPVLIQIYGEGEIFQFPVVVVIDKNNPRTSLNGSSMPNVVPELCLHKNTKITVNTYNTNLEPVISNIKYKCFDTTCEIGKTEGSDAVLTKEFPQCGNGYIIASAEGYETKKELASTIVEGSYNIILDRKYKLNLEVKNKGSVIEGRAVITFSKLNGSSITVSYPDMNEIELTEGQYNIKAYVYSNTSIFLKGSSTQKCVSVPKGNILGMFGVTEEKCFNMQIPDQTIDMAISGGGTQNHYIPESEIAGAKKIIVEPASFGAVAKVEELQLNYNAVETSKLNIYFE